LPTATARRHRSSTRPRHPPPTTASNPVDAPEPDLARVRSLDDRAAERMLAGAFERCDQIDE
jgi:hypothetical protein